MRRRSFMQFSLGLGAAASGAFVTGSQARAGDLAWTSRTLNAMGTLMSLKVAHTDAAHAERALDAAIAEIRHIEDQMSLFREDSAICEFNRSSRLDHPHPDLLAILRVSQDVARRSKGAFVITVQPLWQAFAEAQKQGRLPTSMEVQAARQLVGWRGLEVSERSVRLLRPGMGVTLNGIAHGYAADKVKARLQSMGIAHALVDTDEWASLGKPAHDGDWTLGVANPRDAHALITRVALQGRCVATSADNECTFSPDFANHHIFDPSTGYSPTELSCVSVMAPTCVMADALSKVFFMAGFDRALPLAKHWGVDLLVVDKQGRWKASAGLPLRRV